ncbi:MAG: arginase family protein [Chloroflexota bacterium]
MQNQFMYTPFFIDQPQPDIAKLAQSDWKANQPDLSHDDQYSRMSALNETLSAFVAETVMAGDRPVSVNGDCCVTIGMLAGLQRARIDPLLIWLDAHGDFNTFETSPSGFIGGMPLAMLVGRGEQKLMELAGAKPLPEDQVILTDGRNLDVVEGVEVTASKVQHVNYVDDLLKLDLGDRPIYVHFDTDVLNPNDAPSMVYATEGGPSTKALIAVMKHLASTGRVVAASMTVWDMGKDTDKKTQAACMACLEALVV